MKNEKGRKPARPRLSEKLLMRSGTIGPRMFVISEITKKIRKTSPTIGRLVFMGGRPSYHETRVGNPAPSKPCRQSRGARVCPNLLAPLASAGAGVFHACKDRRRSFDVHG